MRHISILGSHFPKMPIVELFPAVDVAEQNQPQPPQELAPPAFTASVFDKADRLENEVKDIEIEADPALKNVTRTRASACDLTLTLAPATPAGTGVPTTSSGTFGVDFGRLFIRRGKPRRRSFGSCGRCCHRGCRR